ncbi:hypothetical protein IBTHAUMO2_470026 [Nitrosopumilaceae archaeon]|nr:hypothetical protein [Nitrosopumilus sp.]CAI9831909.1 hypothetical protein IBTHAUMO2_470026 [Nitrosopumilaceae archaeon]MDA7944718.1 hypothetical protein [Nitrosopumilus sp.]MDA7954327.1 hypothetical protein [Nitrosopumilus sp.]MDA7960121.1 hypothetical protein [Nitrosopumilus sp.]
MSGDGGGWNRRGPARSGKKAPAYIAGAPAVTAPLPDGTTGPAGIVPGAMRIVGATIMLHAPGTGGIKYGFVRGAG